VRQLICGTIHFAEIRRSATGAGRSCSCATRGEGQTLRPKTRHGRDIHDLAPARLTPMILSNASRFRLSVAVKGIDLLICCRQGH
jgi:hypothetical protein